MDPSAPLLDVLTHLRRERDEAADLIHRYESLAGSLRDAPAWLVPALRANAHRRRAALEEAAALIDALAALLPPEPEPEPVAAAPVPQLDRKTVLRAIRLFELRAKVAKTKADIARTEANGYAAMSTIKELERLKTTHEKSGRAGYVFGFSAQHRLSIDEWDELGFAYGALHATIRTWDAPGRVPTEADREKWDAAVARWRTAIVPCGSALNRDGEIEEIGQALDEALPRPVPVEQPDLATPDSILRIARATAAERQAATAAAVPEGRMEVARVRMKAEVARTKARLERASGGAEESEALAALSRLIRRHDTEFRRDGFVFGFSAAHVLTPAQWETLGEAYDTLAIAMERGVDRPADLAFARDAIERCDAAMKPAVKLRSDDDVEALRDEIADRTPVPAKDDPIAPFLGELEKIESEDTAIDVARRAIAAGVRPSHSALRDALLDWGDELSDSGLPALAPLAREIERERERRETSIEESDEAPPEDEAYLAARERVRALVAGKRMLVVGGLPKPESQEVIRRELDLSEVVWPHADEKKTKPTFFDTYVDNADVILKTRFCRRGFQRAFSRAREAGKVVFSLDAGYNPRQVVAALDRQYRLGD